MCVFVSSVYKCVCVAHVCVECVGLVLCVGVGLVLCVGVARASSERI